MSIPDASKYRSQPADRTRPAARTAPPRPASGTTRPVRGQAAPRRAPPPQYTSTPAHPAARNRRDESGMPIGLKVLVGMAMVGLPALSLGLFESLGLGVMAAGGFFLGVVCGRGWE